MTLETRNKVLCLLLAGTLLLLLALPLVGLTVHTAAGADNAPHFTLFDRLEKAEAPQVDAVAATCAGGGSDNHCGT